MHMPKRYPLALLALALLLLGLSLTQLAARAAPTRAGVPAPQSAPRPVNVGVPRSCSDCGGYADQNRWA
jgi:hypothetical protein